MRDRSDLDGRSVAGDIGRTAPRRGMRLGYTVRAPASVALLLVIDLLVGILARLWPRAGESPREPRRVLLASGGHLGDAVILTSTISLVRKVWPDAEIGVLTGSWTVPVLAAHPAINHLHLVDHWRLNRSGGGWVGKWLRYLETRAAAVREIREVGYEVAFDLYPFVPNSSLLLWAAGIPVRVGYSSGGFGALYTKRSRWLSDDRHVAEHHRGLLASVEHAFATAGPLQYALPETSGSRPLAPGRDYLVVHMGSGLRQKEWPRERWQVLVSKLLAGGHSLVFTGSGPREAEEVREVAGGRMDCHDCVGRLTWDEFVETIRGARAVISVDSVAGHIAGAVGTPVVVLISGINSIPQWQPLGETVEMISNPVACAPCHRSRGCASMACVREIPVDRVLRALERCLRVSSMLQPNPD